MGFISNLVIAEAMIADYYYYYFEISYYLSDFDLQYSINWMIYIEIILWFLNIL